MREYWAKSNPQETIQQHTNNLIKNYETLKALYPNLEINWDILYKACLYHDFGKINKKFQRKITTGETPEKEIPHGILSLAFINPKSLKEEGFNVKEITILAHSIAYHHERSLDYSEDELEEEVNLLTEETKHFEYNKVSDLGICVLSSRYFEKNERINHSSDEDQSMFFNYIKIKGLLNRIDYAASGGIDVEVKNDFLLESMEKLMEKWQVTKPNCNWNPLQRHMINHRNENIITIAETGMGKTEAGLLWIGNNKGFFTLPLKTAINAIYERISKNIIKIDYENKVGLLHSDTYSEYINRNTDEIDIDEYYNKTKQLSLPLTVCTLDQIFDFVYRYRGFEAKLATLAYSKIVIDEVQMYSADLLAYLILGLYYITKVGGKFAILTATLPNLVVDLLREEGIQFVAPTTFTNSERIRHSIKTVHKRLDVEEIIELYNKNKVLVICNTVQEAQRIYKELEDKNIENLNLFHSYFIKEHRKQKENEILQLGRRENENYGIWVTTQVVEASLDIDFDILVTELSDLNGLFQRLGRCYRGREFKEKGYNCYVYDGGEKECTGVGYVIDREIFNLSKKALKEINGPLGEDEKMKLVSGLYTKEKLKETQYYKSIKGHLNYVKSIEDNELDKKEVRKRFRNIDSVTVIPVDIYEKHKEEINEHISIISTPYPKDLDPKDKKALRTKKTVARSNVMEYTLSVPFKKTKGNIKENVEISKYESIPLFKCKYSKKMGLEYIEAESTIKKNQMDRFID